MNTHCESSTLAREVFKKEAILFMIAKIELLFKDESGNEPVPGRDVFVIGDGKNVIDDVCDSCKRLDVMISKRVADCLFKSVIVEDFKIFSIATVITTMTDLYDRTLRIIIKGDDADLLLAEEVKVQ